MNLVKECCLTKSMVQSALQEINKLDFENERYGEVLQSLVCTIAKVDSAINQFTNYPDDDFYYEPTENAKEFIAKKKAKSLTETEK